MKLKKIIAAGVFISVSALTVPVVFWYNFLTGQAAVKEIEIQEFPCIRFTGPTEFMYYDNKTWSRWSVELRDSHVGIGAASPDAPVEIQGIIQVE